MVCRPAFAAHEELPQQDAIAEACNGLVVAKGQVSFLDEDNHYCPAAR